MPDMLTANFENVQRRQNVWQDFQWLDIFIWKCSGGDQIVPKRMVHTITRMENWQPHLTGMPQFTWDCPVFLLVKVKRSGVFNLANENVENPSQKYWMFTSGWMAQLRFVWRKQLKFLHTLSSLVKHWYRSCQIWKGKLTEKKKKKKENTIFGWQSSPNLI